MTINSLVVIPSVFVAAYSIMGIFVLFGRLGDWGLRQIEKRRRKTHLVNECPSCRRQERYDAVAYRLDLGEFYVNSYKRCTACDYKHATHGNPLVFDTETWTLESIRRIDPDYPIARGQVSRDAAESSRSA